MHRALVCKTDEGVVVVNETAARVSMNTKNIDKKIATNLQNIVFDQHDHFFVQQEQNLHLSKVTEFEWDAFVDAVYEERCRLFEHNHDLLEYRQEKCIELGVVVVQEVIVMAMDQVGRLQPVLQVSIRITQQP